MVWGKADSGLLCKVIAVREQVLCANITILKDTRSSHIAYNAICFLSHFLSITVCLFCIILCRQLLYHSYFLFLLAGDLGPRNVWKFEVKFNTVRGHCLFCANIGVRLKPSSFTNVSVHHFRAYIKKKSNSFFFFFF